MNKDDFLKIIEDDDSRLLEIEKRPVSATADDHLTESFFEINEFFDAHGFEPRSGQDIHEHKLASRLKHLRDNKEQKDFLTQYDKHGLLKNEVTAFETMSDIFAEDDFDLLSIEGASIFDIKNVPKGEQRNSAEFIARRIPCKDFNLFENLFLRCQEDIKEGKNKLKRFEHGDVKQGAFFVLDGILLYIESIKMELQKDKHGKEDGRLRCIFENGTESGMKLRSLQKALEISGRTIIDENNQIALAENISSDDTETGYIYVLKSLSTDPQISNVRNLFKIGFSSASVEKRIQSAEQDPTYLIAPVAIVATFKCFNMNPQRLERLLHRFFGKSCLNIDITDRSGNRYTPKEWFIAPISMIERVIELIVNGEIVNYTYDLGKEEIKIIEPKK